MNPLWQDIEREVGWAPPDSDALQAALAQLGEHLPTFAVRLAQDLGEPEVPSPRASAVDWQAWMQHGLCGPHDASFCQARSQCARTLARDRIAPWRVSVALSNLQQSYRATLGLTAAVAVDRLFAVERAIVSQAYQAEADANQARLHHLAMVGQLSSSVGHELRNPLGVIASSLFLLAKQPLDASAQAHLSKIQRQVDTCDRIIAGLLALARGAALSLSEVELDPLFERTLEQLARPTNVTIRRAVAPGTQVLAEPALLEQAVANLVRNAIEAAAGRELTVHIEASQRSDGSVYVAVGDDGPGFDPAILSTAFEPLVSGTAEGSGLGLALVEWIAKRHDARAEALNRPDRGAIVSLVFPPPKPPEANG